MTEQDSVKQRAEFPCNAQRMPFLVDPYKARFLCVHSLDSRPLPLETRFSHDYMNALASTIDASIPYWRLIRSDPRLVYYLSMDSWNPFAYRLNDRDDSRRRLARDMILHYHDHPSSRKIRWMMSVFFTFYGALMMKRGSVHQPRSPEILCVVLAVLFVRTMYRRRSSTGARP